MCGIFGFSQLTSENKLLFPTLAIEMEQRGQTCWGASNGWVSHRQMGPITKTFNRSVLNWDTNNGLILHTRMPSSGTGRGINEAHPFSFIKILSEPTAENNYTSTIREIVGIHNGCIGSHSQLKQQYPDRSDFAVDSMHIFKNICEDLPMTEISGYGAIAWYENEAVTQGTGDNLTILSQAKPKLFIARFNTDALHLAKLPDKSMIFASTKTAIEKALILSAISVEDVVFSTINENTKYQILGSDDDCYVVEIGPMVFGKPYTSTVTGGQTQQSFLYQGGQRAAHQSGNGNGNGAWNGYSGNINRTGLSLKDKYDECPSCNSKDFDPVAEIVCEKCEVKMFREFGIVFKVEEPEATNIGIN